MTQYKLEILHKQGRGYSHLDSPIVSLDDSSAGEFKRNVVKVATNSIEEAEIGEQETPDIKVMVRQITNYWDSNVADILETLLQNTLSRFDPDGVIETSMLNLPEILDGVLPTLDETSLYDLLEDNTIKPAYYGETRMTNSFGVSVVDVHTEDDAPGHDSFVRVIAIKLDGED